MSSLAGVVLKDSDHRVFQGNGHSGLEKNAEVNSCQFWVGISLFVCRAELNKRATPGP